MIVSERIRLYPGTGLKVTVIELPVTNTSGELPGLEPRGDAGPDYPDVGHLKLSTKRGRDEKRSAERYLFVAKQRRGHPRGVSIDPNCHMLRSIWV